MKKIIFIFIMSFLVTFPGALQSKGLPKSAGSYLDQKPLTDQKTAFAIFAILSDFPIV